MAVVVVRSECHVRDKISDTTERAYSSKAGNTHSAEWHDIATFGIGSLLHLLRHHANFLAASRTNEKTRLGPGSTG
jgi:hypothetical protein